MNSRLILGEGRANYFDCYSCSERLDWPNLLSPDLHLNALLPRNLLEFFDLDDWSWLVGLKDGKGGVEVEVEELVLILDCRRQLSF